MQGDVANAADVGRLFKKAVDTFGEINVVVNCAGIMPLSSIAEGDLKLFDKVISTNLRAGYRGVFRYTLTYCNPICLTK